jgi:nitrile hydratase
MNGPHDLGGQLGLGPVKPRSETEESIFYSDWERRVFGLMLAVGALGQWNLDQSRHARERQNIRNYLKNSYYENWLVGLETLLLESGMLTLEELISESPKQAPESANYQPLRSTDVAPMLKKGQPVASECIREPFFSTGQSITVKDIDPTGHTRAPSYVRGRAGIIRACYGAFIYPDKNAKGERVAEYLYNVEFSSATLWESVVGQRNMVRVDLFEPYFDRL